MRYMVVTSRIEVIGHIWMPSVVTAMTYTPDAHDVENMRDDEGNITRAGIERWLDTHAGDFQSVDDFSADIADGDDDVTFGWSAPESEITFYDCMYGGDDA